VVRRSGPQHAPTFVVRVSIHKIGEAEAEGPSKQDAERDAAQAMLEKLK
jgi:ribonuclease-3